VDYQQSQVITKPQAVQGVVWTGTGNLQEDDDQVADEGMAITVTAEITDLAVAPGAVHLGVAFSGECGLVHTPGNLRRRVYVTFGGSGAPGAREVQLRDRNGNLVWSTPYDWGDGNQHEYRVVCDESANTVTLYVDSASLGGPAGGFSGFPTTTGTAARPIVSTIELQGTGQGQVTLYSTSTVPNRVVAVPGSGSVLGKTLGVPITRASRSRDIDDYVLPTIPRIVPGYGKQNSKVSDCAIQNVDWQQYTQVVLNHTPTWGSTISVNGPPPSGFSFHVENAHIPVIVDTGTGTPVVAFGCGPDSAAITRMTWRGITSYTLWSTVGGGPAANPGTLNRSTQFRSGEYLKDLSPEVSGMLTVDGEGRINVHTGTGIQAARIYSVRVDGTDLVPAHQYTFDPVKTQTIEILEPYRAALIGAQVVVVFAPYQRVTRKYICDRPVSETVTVLNEGTPTILPGPTQAASVEKCLSYTTAPHATGSRISTACDSEGLTEIVIDQPSRMLSSQICHTPPPALSPYSTMLGSGYTLAGGRYDTRSSVTLNSQTTTSASLTHLASRESGVRWLMETTPSGYQEIAPPPSDSYPVHYVLEDYGAVTTSTLNKSVIGLGWILSGGSPVVLGPSLVTQGVIIP
jgi:hypothetical protein